MAPPPRIRIGCSLDTRVPGLSVGEHGESTGFGQTANPVDSSSFNF